jgi:hypothetical protein
MSMTSKEVVNALIRGEKAERIGLFEHGAWQETMAAWVKQGYPTHLVAKKAGEMRWSPEDGRCLKVTTDGEYPEPDNFGRHFDHDMIHCGGFPDWLPLRGVNETIEETDEWAIIRNGAGAAFKHWKHQEGTPGPVDFRMTSRAVWDRDYRPHLLAFDPDRVYPEGVGVRLWREQEPLLRDKWGDKLLFVGGFDERILETNDRTIIRREITEYLTGMKARGARLLFATDHSISPRVHYETYRYAMEVYRENMGY